MNLIKTDLVHKKKYFTAKDSKEMIKE